MLMIELIKLIYYLTYFKQYATIVYIKTKKG